MSVETGFCELELLFVKGVNLREPPSVGAVASEVGGFSTSETGTNSVSCIPPQVVETKVKLLLHFFRESCC
ncbi:hypothetical protein DPMN_052200 [Dreissena polymorpha]|uniref:Uncharacterized protein n=1 Tax=Dreissena polymorpha TaxID=45954 RepID=A0A9D4CL05_DREPO|nr:hypothetical protein DPMN_052200 [Dreissena polymorpha]